MKSLLFILRAGEAFGLGHYFRSMSLINILMEKNYKISIAHNASEFWNKNKQNHIDYYPLRDFNLHELIEVVEASKPDKVFIDGNITFDEEFWLYLSKRTIPLFNYQNLTQSKQFCDVFILPSIHQGEIFFKDFDLEKTKIYQGLKYFTFNNKILNIDKFEVRQKVQEIAIITGGSDPNNLTLFLFNALKDYDKKDFRFNFFLGDNYMHRDLMNNLKKADFIKFSGYNKQEIINNDLLISAFGVSTYEFMALGMPIITIGHNKSNALAANYLADKTKALISLGAMENLTYRLVQETLNNLTEESVSEILLNVKKILDLKGNERVVKIIENE